MEKIDYYPKSIKKALRYIKQDASLTQLKHLEEILIKSINHRKEDLKKKITQ